MIALLTQFVSLPVINTLSRARESAADRTAATVTGSPAALASALRTLDERIAETPFEDLRKASALSSLSILPLDPIEAEPVRAENGLGELIGALFVDAIWLCLATHPSTERRIEALSALSEERQTEP